MPEHAWCYDDSVEFDHDGQTLRGYVRFEEKPGVFEVLVVDHDDYDELLVPAGELRLGPVTLVQHLTECRSNPPHPRLWVEIEEHRDYYGPLTCPLCELDAARKQHEGCEHAGHARWRSWLVAHRLLSWAYSMGITATHGWQFGGGCPGCVDVPRLHGRRLYILGFSREWWRCLLRYHHRRVELGGNLCGKCCPCTGCGSITWAHEPGCGEDPENWTPDPLIAAAARRAVPQVVSR